MPLDNSTQINVTTNNGTFAVWDESTGEENGNGRVREVFAKDRSQNKAETQWLCKWSDRQKLALGLLDNSIAIAGSTAYSPAVQYPDFTYFLANRVEISGDGLPSVGPNGTIAFERARLRTLWMPPDYQPGSAVGLSELNLDFSSNAVPLDQSGPSFQFDSTHPLPPSAYQSFRFTTILFSLTRYNVPSLPFAQIKAAIDHTNSGSFEGAAAETVIFRGARTSTSFSGNNSALLWKILYVLEVHSIDGGWNKAPQQGKTPLWQPITLMDGSTKPFPSTSFSFITN